MMQNEIVYVYTQFLSSLDPTFGIYTMLVQTWLPENPRQMNSN